ncbi:MAG: biotin--[acetyl-CoA-carboxylase] ligase [Deinococcaceae bacterium]
MIALSHIVQALSEQPQTPLELARGLKCSPEKIQKLLQVAQDLGYPILSSAAGYTLECGTPAPSNVSRFLRGSFGHSYTYLGTLDSTQNLARFQAKRGIGQGAVVLAERQTRGRGRRGRSWTSGRGLYFSLVLQNENLALDRLPLLSLAVGVALHAACGVGKLKYPNDLLAPDGRKLAGVLLEASVRGSRVQYVVVGIGLNTHKPDHLPPHVAALEAFQPNRRDQLLAGLLYRLEQGFRQSPESILEHWRANNCTLGSFVQISTRLGRLEGVAQDIDASGVLSIETTSGIQRVQADEVEWIHHWQGDET